MQMQSSTMGQADTGSVALPAVLRAGESGPSSFSMGSLQPAKFSSTSHQAHTGHMLSNVSIVVFLCIFMSAIWMLITSKIFFSCVCNKAYFFGECLGDLCQAFFDKSW